LYLFQAQPVSEPSVAVHDEGHMLWQLLSGQEQRNQASNAPQHRN
jgi:hypothetical protein